MFVVLFMHVIFVSLVNPESCRAHEIINILLLLQGWVTLENGSYVCI